MYRKNYNKILTSLFLAILVALGSCNIGDIDSNIEVPNLTGDWIAPIGEATYTVAELLQDLESEDLDIDTTQAGLLSIIYRDTTSFDDIDQVIEIGDVVNEGSVASPIDIPTVPPELAGDTTFTQPLSFEYPIDNDEELDSILYSTGNITITYRSTFDVPMTFELKMDDITHRDTNVAMEFTDDVSPNGSGNQTLSLENYRTIATLDTVTNINIFTGTFEGTLTLEEGDVVSSDDVFEFEISITDIDFETIYGYFGKKELELEQQTIQFDFFDEIDGNITLNSPEIRLIIDNGFGLTMGIDLSGISAVNTDGDSLSLSGEITDDLAFVNAPDINSVGDSRASVVTINSDNSNLRELFQLNPNTFYIDLGAQTNFSDIESIIPYEDRNFVGDSSIATSIIEVEIPLDLSLTDFTNEFDFSIEEVEFEEADTIGIRLKSLNRIPINGTFDMQFLDADSVETFTITDVQAFSSPEVPSNGIVGPDDASESIDTIILYEGNGLEEFKTSPIMRILMNIDSHKAEEGEFVQIFDDYDIKLFVGLEAYINLPLK
ncbi:MAG: hypothetical protein OCD76_13670 [Reichenbachiella sp.]